jgi:putative spermidine/putrescine transport system permease protein
VGEHFQLLGIAPFTLPPVITALGLLTFWATIGFYGQPWTAVVSHAIFFVTLPLVTLSLGFSAIDRSLVEAASTLGADDRTVFRTVVLPLILPYVVSGYAFAFVLSLNEYIVAYMTVGFTVETLPIKIFNALRYGYTPTMASVTILFVVTAAVIFSLVARFGDLPKARRDVDQRQMMRLGILQMQAACGDVAANLGRIEAPPARRRDPARRCS